MPHLSPLPWFLGVIIIWITVFITPPQLPLHAWVTEPDSDEDLCDPAFFPWYDIRHFFLIWSTTIST